MSDIRNARNALVKRILEGDGKAPLSTRRAAFDDSDLAEPIGGPVDKVVTDKRHPIGDFVYAI